MGATFILHLNRAHDKNPGSLSFRSLHDYVRDTCIDASSRSRDAGIECRWHHAFFTSDTIQALQLYAFLSGKRPSSLANLNSVLTPWHFVLSIPPTPGYHQSSSRALPASGLPAQQILDTFQNMFFLMHLPFWETRQALYVGKDHSPASRWSPFFGHLLHLINIFHSRQFQHHWDSCPSQIRCRLTESIFIAVSELIAIFETWSEPNFDNTGTFLQARHHHRDLVVLLNPYLSSEGILLSDALLRWRRQLGTFSVEGIQCALPTEGWFALPTPPCFRPGTSLPTPQPWPLPTSSLPPAPTSSSSPPPSRPTPQTPSSRGRTEGESTARHKARTCLFVHSSDGKSIGELLRILNKDRSSSSKILSPAVVMPNKQRVPICFAFTSENGQGCRAQRCRFLHLDLAVSSTWPHDIPTEFFHKVLEFLQLPAIQPHYKASSAFTAFLAAR
jgi:hypothetical protein